MGCAYFTPDHSFIETLRCISLCMKIRLIRHRETICSYCNMRHCCRKHLPRPHHVTWPSECEFDKWKSFVSRYTLTWASWLVYLKWLSHIKYSLIWPSCRHIELKDEAERNAYGQASPEKNVVTSKKFNEKFKRFCLLETGRQLQQWCELRWWWAELMT